MFWPAWQSAIMYDISTGTGTSTTAGRQLDGSCCPLPVASSRWLSMRSIDYLCSSLQNLSGAYKLPSLLTALT